MGNIIPRNNLYTSYTRYQNMVKTIRLTDEIHKELMKIQGEMQAQTGELTTMDDTIKAMVDAYKKKHR